MKPDKAVMRLEEDFDFYSSCPVLLDSGIIDSFLEWLDARVDFYELLKNKRIRIGVLQPHMIMRADWPILEGKLRDRQIELLQYNPTDSDNKLTNEILEAYFGGIKTARHRRSAQLLAYGRKNVEEDDVQIVSQHRIFRFIPNVQLYFVPGLTYTENDEEVLNSSVLDMLEIDPRIWEAVESQMRIGDYHAALFKAVNTFYNELRRVGGNATDGRELVQQTLSNIDNNVPSIRLNASIVDLDPGIEKNDQRGYYELACGVTAAVRNIVSHPKDHDFIRQRFGKRSTVLKFLGLFSLLTERLPKQ